MAARALFPVLVSLWLLPWQQAPQPPPVVGFVLSMAGQWQVTGRIVKQGEAVAPGARLVLAPGATFGRGESYWIDIVLLNNKAVSMRCITAEACRPGLSLPASLAPSTLASRISDVFQLIFTRPERYVGVLSRGASGDGGAFTDGVAQLQENRLALSPFFEGLVAGRYRLLFSRLAPASSSERAPVVDLVWDQTAPSAIVQSAVTTGLYRVTLSRPADAAFASREAWILVAADDRYASAKAAFDEGVAITRGWDRSVPARDVAIFRHAWLTELAGQSR